MESVCSKYDKTTVWEDFNMLLEKEWNWIVVTTRELVRQCLNCKEFKECKIRFDLIKLLENNTK